MSSSTAPGKLQTIRTEKVEKMQGSLLTFYVPVQTHYVISEGQPDLDVKQSSSLSSEVPVGVSQPPAHADPLEPQTSSQQQTTQYIITTSTNGSGGSEVHITKPRTFPAEHE